MMYALGDMDGVICLAGALCKTWALLFTGEFGGLVRCSLQQARITHVRGEVWARAMLSSGKLRTYPRARGSLVVEIRLHLCGIDLPTCAGEFGALSLWVVSLVRLTHVCREVW